MMKLVLKSSAFAAIFGIIYSHLIFEYGFYGNSALSSLNLIFTGFFTYYAVSLAGKRPVKFFHLKGLMVGCIVGILSAVIYGAWYSFYITAINPEVVYNSYNTPELREELLKEGLDEEEVNRTIRTMSEELTVWTQYAGIVIVTTLFSFIISVIAVILSGKGVRHEPSNT